METSVKKSAVRVVKLYMENGSVTRMTDFVIMDVKMDFGAMLVRMTVEPDAKDLFVTIPQAYV